MELKEKRRWAGPWPLKVDIIRTSWMLIRSAELRPRPDPPIKVGISTRVLGTPHTPYCLTGAAPVQLGTVQKGNRGPEKAKVLPEVTQQVRFP